MAKIAAGLERALAQRLESGSPGTMTGRVLAAGNGWMVRDVVCTCTRHDHPFEEQHTDVAVAVVLAGTFQYRSDDLQGIRTELMVPGMLLLGNPGQYFECAHDHAKGDRCLSFQYRAEYFARLGDDLGVKAEFPVLRLPAARQLSPIVTKGYAGLTRAEEDVEFWEETALHLAAEALGFAQAMDNRERATPPPSAVRSVAKAVRHVEREADGRATLAGLAQAAGVSPYHFLRIFEQLTGVTPHQYVRRLRLREAALRLATETSKVVDIALESGFGDVSNFNRSFRAEFGVNPRAYREGSRVVL